MVDHLPKREHSRINFTPKLGALPSRPGLVTPDAELGVQPVPPDDYRSPKESPAVTDLTDDKSKWSSLGNGDAGDCVIAAAVHMAQIWARHAQKREIVVSEQDMLSAYTEITGWDPRRPESDTGMTVKRGLDYMKDKGIGGCRLETAKRIGAPFGDEPVMVSRLDLCRYVAWLGGVIVAVHLPLAAWSRPTGPWKGDMGDNIKGGHAFPIVSYDGNVFEIITWGYVISVDFEFLKKYAFEAWVCTGLNWFGPNQLSADFDLKHSDIDFLASKCAFFDHILA